MSEKFAELKRDYQSIEAPPYLASRVKANVARPTRRRGWLPVAATGLVALAAVALVPMLLQDDTNTPIARTPSLSALATMTASTPPVTTPKLSQLKTFSIPTMPAKPARPDPKPEQPQTHFDSRHDDLEETHHADA